MPYIIEHRYSDCDFPRDCGECAITRTAVASLDEAREAAEDVVTRAQGDTFEASDERFDCRELPEAGGTTDPLPDGTVVEVRPVTWARLTHDAGLPVWHLTTDPLPEHAAAILTAYNARQEG